MVTVCKVGLQRARAPLRSVVLVLALVLAVASGCGADAPRELVVVGGETRDDAEKGGYALLDGEIQSNPAPTIRVKVGEPVRLRFENHHGQFHGESIPHDVVIVKDMEFDHYDELVEPDNVLWGARTDAISPGHEAQVIEFTPDKPGTYYYVCSLVDHIPRGMWGEFVVEE